MPIDKEDLPGTIQRSSKKAQRTFEKTLESAEETYEDDERAYRTAYAALKHTHERKGDRWVAKKEKGPSDPRAERGAPDEGGETFGGVDYYGNTRQELYERAKRLGISGRSKMDKKELARAIARRQ